MKIVDFSVRNYQFTIVMFVLALALGIDSLLNMPRGEDPNLKVPTYTIIAVYPGTSPKDMEKMVTKPIEDKINELNDIKRMKSEINDGLSVTQVEFNYGVNIDDKYNEVVREVNSLKGTLPDLQSLEIQKVEASDVNTYQLALLSNTATYKELYDKADEFKTQIEKVYEVKKVKILGYPEQQVKVAVDLEKITANHLSLGRLMAAIQAQAMNIPGGSIDAGGKKFNIKTSGDYTNLEQIRNTIVASSADRIVYLKDVAAVTDGYEDQTYITRFNGKRCVFLSVNEKEKTNIIEVNKKLAPVIVAFAKKLPANMAIENKFVQAQDVDRRLSHFLRDFVIAIILVMVTLTPLGWRASLVVMISIPLSIALGLALLNVLGYTINQLTIVGLVVALGLLVDDSIVVIENIERYLRLGYSPFDAAIQATRQIGVAIVGCTAILIVSFLPLLFLPEASGDFIRSLPMAVVTTIFSSLVVSITVVPFLARLILKKHVHEGGNVILRTLQKGIGRVFDPLLRLCLRYPRVTIGSAIVLCVASFVLMGSVGFSLFPRSEKPMFLVNIETPLGTNLYKTDSVARFVEAELLKNKKVNAVFTNVGRGNPRIYYNVTPHEDAVNYSQLFVRLDEMGFDELEQTVEQLRSKFNRYPDAKIEVKQFEQGPPIESPVAIRVFGNDLDSLRQLSARVEAIIKSTEGVIYTNNPLQTYTSDMRVHVDKDKAALIGILPNEVDRTVRMGIAGLNIADFKDEKGDSHPINVSLARSGHPRIGTFDKLYVASPTGSLVPLNLIADLKFETSVPVISRFNRNRYVLVTSYVKNGYNTQQITRQILKKLDNMHFPEGYSYVAAGEVESSQDSFGGLGTIILITVFAFLGVLLLEFRTFKSALIVLCVIPLGLIGAVMILLVTHNTLSFVAIIGIIALSGICVKNSILLVDYTNHLRAEGMSLNKAIEHAGETRFLPILLTSLTAIMGLVPLVLEQSPFFSPLAWVLIGGLSTSTVLTLLVISAIYRLMPPDVKPAPSSSANPTDILNLK
jgi:multidrug efflux pump subunit AcrB